MRLLTPAQAAALRDKIQPMINFLFACRHRMETLDFDHDSVIYQAIDKAYCAVNELRVTLDRQSRHRPGS